MAEHIDQQIHAGYVLYPCNYISVDMLKGNAEFADKYTAEQKAYFEAYIAKKVSMIKIENKDEAFLRERILTMYANPALNKLCAEK